ncbi:MAG: PhoH-like protein [Alphaproteobacteria bacterium MarineAlpha11_Bin1]|nr:MAG: PhoH-like protein [Alphaproteobacteria bacterium MarineAlpha11_Bin1]
MTKVDTHVAGVLPVVLEFEDNKLLPLLYGDFDRHLARIEQVLDVTVASRGNTVTIGGGSAAVDIARVCLESLYCRLVRGLEVSTGEVDAAIRLARNASEEDRKGFDESANGKSGIRTPKRHISARSSGQQRYIRALLDNELSFGLGPAGTGKTYLAVGIAVSMLTSRRVDRIIISRPAVEAGERLGFLPGDMRDKIDPYLRPLYDALYDMMAPEQVDRKLESGEIEVAPLAFMRGRTLSNAYVILDEAQNATAVQMKMFLTRLGENARMVVTGDLSQIDLPPGVTSGLHHAIRTLEGVDGVASVHLSADDVVRHELVSRIVNAYDAADE